MFLYSTLLLISILVPIVLSFDKKLQFYKKWKFLLPSIFIVALFFIFFDIYFTKIGVWGFNPNYVLNISFYGLPLEELLFFFVIPYASIFLHESIILYYPNVRLAKSVSNYISGSFILLSTIIIILNYNKVYTVFAFSIFIFSLILSFFDKGSIIRSFYFTFLVILIPFVLLNGILTGSLIDGEVVWYNDNENLGVRLLTIPVEDFAYGFSLIFLNIFLTYKLNGDKTDTEPKNV